MNREPISKSQPAEPARDFGWRRLILFMLFVPGIGLAIGAVNVPGPWYAALNKPEFNPPDWIFAPVWTLLFLMIALAGFLTFEGEPRGAAARLWTLQMVLNFAWSPVFFSFHRIGLALAIIIVLFATIGAFVWREWDADRTAALLFIPYAVWIGFATTLNMALFVLN